MIDLDERARKLLMASYAKAEDNLAHFVKRAWKVLEPETPLLWNWHMDLLCEELMAVERGDVKRLIINVPPRSAKSIIVTICFPVWCWVRQPHKRFMAASYSASLSTKHSVDRRTLIESDWFQYGYGTRFELSSDQNVKTEFTNTKRGHMISTSITGTATGKGCDILIVDDPQNPKEAHSKIERDKANKTFDTTFMSRLDNKKEGAVIIVMQRLDKEDLTGHVLGKPKNKEEGGHDWRHVKLPAETTTAVVYEFPISGRKYHRKAGEVLHEAREGRAELAAARIDMGTADFSAQYNQDPTSAEGELCKRKWFKFYTVLPKLETKIQSWDCTFKDAETSDFVCGLVLGRKGADIYLVDRVKEKLDIVGTIAAVKSLTLKHPDSWGKYVEDKANGTAIIALLKSKISGLIAVNPQGSKAARFHSVLPLIQAGNYHLPDPSIADWVDDYIDELCSFPKVKHDDQVDATSQGLDQLRGVDVDALEKLASW